MSVLFLSPDDFYIGNSQDGPVLLHRLKGLSLVLFYSNDCDHCKTFIPKFKQCPGGIYNCSFAMANVDLQDQRIIEMSMSTVMKIKYTPLLMLYVEGKPEMAYNGPREPKEIAQFIYNFVNRIATRENVIAAKCKVDEESKIPGFCMGIPYTGDDDVCYVNFGKAYANK